MKREAYVSRNLHNKKGESTETLFSSRNGIRQKRNCSSIIYHGGIDIRMTENRIISSSIKIILKTTLLKIQKFPSDGNVARLVLILKPGRYMNKLYEHLVVRVRKREGLSAYPFE